MCFSKQEHYIFLHDAMLESVTCDDTLMATNSEGTVEQWYELMVDSEEEWEEWEEEEEEEETEGTTAPVPVEAFRDYVAKNHANSNKGFRNQFQVMGIALLGVGGGIILGFRDQFHVRG